MNDFDATGTSKSEHDRITRLRQRLDLDLTDFLCEGYDAVALHSSSILIAVNAPAAEMFGYSPDEMVGMNSWTLFPPQSAEALLKHLITRSEAPYSVDAVHKNGSLFRVELVGKDFEVAGEPVRAVLLRRLP